MSGSVGSLGVLHVVLLGGQEPLGVLESPGTLEVRFCVGVGVGGEPVGLVGAFPETLG